MMRRLLPGFPIRRAPAGCALALLLAAAALAQSNGDGDWKLEQVTLKNGRSYGGLVLKEPADEVVFQIVRRKPGRVPVVFTATFPRGEVKRLDKLAGKDRDELVARINALTADGTPDDPRLKYPELKPAVFVGSERKDGLRYESDHFELFSNAGEDVVRRAAARLEQIYAAYAFHLPPVNRPAKPNTTTRIYLFQSLPEYQAVLKGRNIFNPAFYDASANEIICAAELKPLTRQLEEVRRHQAEQLERLKKQEAEVARLPKGEVQERARQQLQEARRELTVAAARNEELFRAATRQLFHSLYHEAFHAYLANFVFPPDKGEVPRWLNEGLAQIFETAITAGNELNVGQVDPARLEMAKTLAGKDGLVPLTDLLRSNAAQFVVAHGQDRQAADRYYLTAWALMHYLMIERKLLGSAALDDYLAALNGKLDPVKGTRERPADPLEALSKLAGQPIPQLDKELRDYILKLQP
ncbi:MAG: DUF1570 domain-containing protein [Planctomycetia bacterium]|nr:DUF1570 domain-containing protein [Planctomycetia bacterium]